MLNAALPRLSTVPQVHRSSSRRGHKRVVVRSRRHMIAAQQRDDNTADPLDSLVTDPVLRVALREPIAFFGGMFAGVCLFASFAFARLCALKLTRDYITHRAIQVRLDERAAA
jgi:hypothetical protein